jgi:cytochrome c oxidase subunit 3
MAKQAEFAALGILPYRKKNEVPWLALTVLLGFLFLVGQVIVWNGFRHQGLFRHSNPSSSFFVILTGMHALHLTGGLAALLYATAGNWMRIRFDSQQLAVTVTAWYWHFMGVLWLYLFALLHFARG